MMCYAPPKLAAKNPKGTRDIWGCHPPVMTWILYHLACCPYRNGNALRVRRGSFSIWSNRKTLKP